MMQINFQTKSQQETFALGMALVPFLKRGDVITLSGDLGAGKTTLTTGVARALNVTDKVISPTFNIMKCYFKATIPLYHIDAYRLEDGNKDIGLEEFIEGDGITMIEWPQYIQELIPENAIRISIKHVEGDIRDISIVLDDHHHELAKALKERFSC